MSQKSIILLHGALGSARQFDQLTKVFSASFEVHSFSFEGHGGVEANRQFSMNHFMENVVDYMDEHQLEKPSVFGYSMGGFVALTLALNYPQKVNKIITLGTKFDWTPEFAAAEVRKLNPEMIEEKVPRFAEHLRRTHEPLDWKKVVDETAEMMIRLGEKNPLKQNESSKIWNPTLVLLGELDRMSTVEESKRLAHYLQNGSFEELPNFEHAIDKVDEVVLGNRIMDFLNS